MKTLIGVWAKRQTCRAEGVTWRVRRLGELQHLHPDQLEFCLAVLKRLLSNGQEFPLLEREEGFRGEEHQEHRQVCKIRIILEAPVQLMYCSGL